MNTLKLALIALVAAVAGAAAYAAPSGAPPVDQLRDPVQFKVIDDFLSVSKRYLNL